MRRVKDWICVDAELSKFAIIVFLFIVFLIILSYYKLSVSFIGNIDGDLGSWYALVTGNAHTLNKGEFPLWFPYLFFGGGTTGSALFLSSFYPINIIFELMYFDTTSNYLKIDFLFPYILTHKVIFVTSFYLLYRVLNFKRFLALIATLVVAFSTSTLSTSGWINIWTYIAYYPLIISFVILTYRNNNCKS